MKLNLPAAPLKYDLTIIHRHTIIPLPCSVLKGSAADCRRTNPQTIHIKQYSGNSIKLCERTSLSVFF